MPHKRQTEFGPQLHKSQHTASKPLITLSFSAPALKDQVQKSVGGRGTEEQGWETEPATEPEDFPILRQAQDAKDL